MAEQITIPDAPKHLSVAVQQKWQDAYLSAYKQAKLDTPDNERAQRIAALKTANRMLAVPAPASAAEIDALEDWQVMKRDNRLVDGVSMRICITTDGRKYQFPLDAPEPEPGPKKSKAAKPQDDAK